MIRCVVVFISRKSRPGPGASLVIEFDFGSFVFASCIFVWVGAKKGIMGGGEVSWEVGWAGRATHSRGGVNIIYIRIRITHTHIHT